MKKMLYAVVTAVAALTLVGCGGKPKIPENTVAACYIDLEKCLESEQDIAELVIDNLPKPLKSKAQDNYDEVVRQYKKEFKQFNFKWATVTVGPGKHRAEAAVVVKCDYTEKGESGKNLIGLLEAATGEKTSTKFGVDVFYGTIPKFGTSYVAFVDEQYVILTSDEDTLEKMVRLYGEGEGKTSDAFDDLTDLGSDTVARFQTADAETIVDILDMRSALESLGEQCDDEDLVDDILDIGNVTLDLNISDDVLGYELTVEAGSKEFAKVVEGAFNILALGNRLGADGLAAAGTYGRMLSSFTEDVDAADFVKIFKSETLKTLAAMMRKGLSVDRSGSTVTVSYEIDTEDLVELIVPPLAEAVDRAH